VRPPAAHQKVAQAILDCVGAPGAGREGFLAAYQEVISRADEDLRHALTWGWTPGTSRVRRYFGPATEGPYEGLAWWLDHGPEAFASHCQGVSKKLYTPTVKGCTCGLPDGAAQGHTPACALPPLPVKAPYISFRQWLDGTPPGLRHYLENDFTPAVKP
jgi:hypothetical protein